MKTTKEDFEKALCAIFGAFDVRSFDSATERLFWSRGVPEEWEREDRLVTHLILESHRAGRSMIVAGQQRIDPFGPDACSLTKKEVRRVREAAVARMADMDRRYREMTGT